MIKSAFVSISIAFLSTFVVLTVSAQEKLPPIHHAPDREFHAINIDLSLKFDLQKKEVFGTAVEKIVPLRVNLDTVHLDAVDMTINKVSMSGRSLGYNYDGKTLSIGLSKSYGLDDTLTYTITYSTFPKKGIFFVEADSAYPDRAPQVWSQSEMEDARYWFPCHDYPDDFLTSSVTATVPEDWTVVSNGVMEKETTARKDSTKTFKWVESKPHVIYLISIVAGKYSIVDDHYGKVPIYYYVAPEYAKYAKENFSHTPDILKFYSDATGYEYPWQKLALSTVTDFTFGGMENVSAITLTDNTMHNPDAEPQESSTDLVSHETAHQWFGDLLTCRSWSNAWLNEGFATYFEALYGEHAFGEDHFNYEMYHDHQEVVGSDNVERRPTVYNRYYNSVDLFGIYIYPRGASILHMLRGIVGKELFFKAIQHYVHKSEHQNVDSHDFANAVREATGYNLNWFFDEWLYKGGHPVFNVNYDCNDSLHSLVLHVAQTQKVDSMTPVYRMPVDIYIVTPSQKMTKTVWVDSLSNTYTFDVAEKPLMVNFDEDDYLLKELNFKKSVDELSYQLKNDPDVVGRVWAADELSDQTTNGAEDALIDGLKGDSFWGVRMTCAQALSNFDDKKVEEALKEAIGDSDARIQDEAIKGLAKYKDAALAPLLEQLYNSQKNYFVRAAAVKALASIEGEKATPILEDALTQDSFEQVIKIAALNSLVMIDSAKAYDEAVEFTKYGEPQPLRLQGMNEMVRLKPKSEETVNLLKKYLDDPYIWTRMVAINSLGRVGDKSIVPLLQDREKAETDGRLQQAARRAIESINKRESRGSE
ncbi:MAG: M1 family aminopeptidase [Candidatus Kryptoniota bacterium]